jgi:hypothetical protein
MAITITKIQIQIFFSCIMNGLQILNTTFMAYKYRVNFVNHKGGIQNL